MRNEDGYARIRRQNLYIDLLAVAACLITNYTEALQRDRDTQRRLAEANHANAKGKGTYVCIDHVRLGANVSAGLLQAQFTMRCQELEKWNSFASQSRCYLNPVAIEMVAPRYPKYCESSKALMENFWSERFQLAQALSIYA